MTPIALPEALLKSERLRTLVQRGVVRDVRAVGRDGFVVRSSVVVDGGEDERMAAADADKREGRQALPKRGVKRPRPKARGVKGTRQRV